MNKNKKQHFINREIRATEVRVAEVGVMTLSNALKMAEEQDLDLVLMSSSANPPVCRIMNYEKFIYEQNKKDKNKPKTPDLKEVKFSRTIGDNDITYRVKQIIEFLQKGHKVKLSMRFGNRELTYSKDGEQVLLNVIVKLEEYGVAEYMPKLEGRNMFVTVRPKSK